MHPFSPLEANANVRRCPNISNTDRHGGDRSRPTSVSVTRGLLSPESASKDSFDDITVPVPRRFDWVMSTHIKSAQSKPWHSPGLGGDDPGVVVAVDGISARLAFSALLVCDFATAFRHPATSSKVVHKEPTL